MWLVPQKAAENERLSKKSNYIEELYKSRGSKEEVESFKSGYCHQERREIQQNAFLALWGTEHSSLK